MTTRRRTLVVALAMVTCAGMVGSMAAAERGEPRRRARDGERRGRRRLETSAGARGAMVTRSRPLEVGGVASSNASVDDVRSWSEAARVLEGRRTVGFPANKVWRADVAPSVAYVVTWCCGNTSNTLAKRFEGPGKL